MFSSVFMKQLTEWHFLSQIWLSLCRMSHQSICTVCIYFSKKGQNIIFKTSLSLHECISVQINDRAKQEIILNTEQRSQQKTRYDELHWSNHYNNYIHLCTSFIHCFCPWRMLCRKNNRKTSYQNGRETKFLGNYGIITLRICKWKCWSQCFSSDVSCFNWHKERSSTNLAIYQNSVSHLKHTVANAHIILYSGILLYVGEKEIAVSHWVRHSVRHREGCGLQLWPLSLDSGQIQMTNANRQRAVHAHMQAQTSKIYVCAYDYACT